MRRRTPRAVVAGLGLAAALAVLTPVAANAVWSSTATAALGVEGAPFGMTSAAGPTGGSVLLDAAGGTSAQAEIGFLLGSLSGAPAWTSAVASVQVTSGASSAGLAVSIAQSTSVATCGAPMSYTPGSPTTAVPLGSSGDGGQVLLCVRVSLTGLGPADAGQTVVVTVSGAAALGGWSATAPVIAGTLTIVDVAPPAVLDAVCTPTTDGWYLGWHDAVDFVLPDGEPYEPIGYVVTVDAPVGGMLSVKEFWGDGLAGNDGRPTLGANELGGLGLPDGPHTFTIAPEGAPYPIAQFVATVSGDPGEPDVTCGGAG